MSYAAMLTPDLDEARTLTDEAIVSVLGSLRAPRGDLTRDTAIRDAIARGYADRHRTDARSSPAPHPGASVFAPPQQWEDGQASASRPSAEEIGVGVGKTTSPLAAALGTLSPAERLAAVSWWIDGVATEVVADRLDTTHNSAVDLLHRAGVALAAATGGTAPQRDHYAGGSDVVTVEVSKPGGRS